MEEGNHNRRSRRVRDHPPYAPLQQPQVLRGRWGSPPDRSRLLPPTKINKSKRIIEKKGQVCFSLGVVRALRFIWSTYSTVDRPCPHPVHGKPEKEGVTRSLSVRHHVTACMKPADCKHHTDLMLHQYLCTVPRAKRRWWQHAQRTGGEMVGLACVFTTGRPP